ncbi:MAG: kinase [Peptostreptococcaceae bacterium]
MKFDINGAKVQFDEKRHNYNLIRKEFKFFAKKSKDYFINESVNSTNNLTILKENSLYIYKDIISKSLNKSIETIVNYRLITIDKKTFEDVYANKYIFFEKSLNNKVKSLMQRGKKNNYLSFEALNEVVNEISNYIYNDCFNMHRAVIDALLNNEIPSIGLFICDKDKKVSNSLFNNYKDGFIHKIDEGEVVSKMIMLNPYNLDMYEYLIEEDGDFNFEIERLVDYLGYDIREFKENLMDKYIKEIISENNLDSEFDKEKVLKYARYIGANNDELYSIRIDAIYIFQDA